MIVEDYSLYLFEHVRKTALPTVRAGKFVHIVGPTEEYLILSPTELTKYHAHIVERFCQLHSELTCTPSRAGDAALFDQSGWQVRGGGRFHLDSVEKILALWDSSKAYGVFDANAIREELRSHPDWSAYAVQLGD